MLYDLYKASIGIVQKVPRILGYLNNVGARSREPENNRRTLLSGENFRIELDYNNMDFFQRSALETQYIIDGKGKLNENISQDITTWRRDFLFPGEYKVEIDNFNKQFAAEFMKEMSMYGITPEYAERKYAETIKDAKDAFIRENVWCRRRWSGSKYTR